MKNKSDNYLEFLWLEVPASFSGKSGHIDTLRNVDAAGEFVDVLERSLNSVKDGTHDAGAQLN